MTAFLIVPLLSLILQQPTPASTQEVNFSYALTGPAVDPVYGVSLESTVPAVNLALQYISNATNLLPSISLTYQEIMTKQVGFVILIMYLDSEHWWFQRCELLPNYLV